MRYTSRIIVTGLLNRLDLQDAAEVTRVINSLKTFWMTTSQTNLSLYLKHPHLETSDRVKLMEGVLDLFSFSDEVREFLVYLGTEKRMAVLPKIIEHLKEFRRAKFKTAEGEVVTVSPLNDSQREKIKRILAKMSGFEVHFEEKLDPEILGGVILQSEDWIIDSSFRRRLRQVESIFFTE